MHQGATMNPAPHSSITPMSSNSFASPGIASLVQPKQMASILKKKLEQKKKVIEQKEQTGIANQQFPSKVATNKFSIPKELMFSEASQSYFVLNSLYQSFKKQNEFKLLQEKVHKIKVHNPEHARHSSELATKNQHVRVTPHTICANYDGKLNFGQISKFIQIERFIKQGVRNELLNEILRCISNLTDIKEVMKCYQMLFRSQSCRGEIKRFVEEKMIKKVLSMDFCGASEAVSEVNLSEQSSGIFQQIGMSLLGFPEINTNVLCLIGMLFDKLGAQVADFDFLYMIFQNNCHLKSSLISQQNSQELNDEAIDEYLNDPENKQEVGALLKINNKRNNEIIRKLIQRANAVKATEKCHQIYLLEMAEAEAKYKILKLIQSQQLHHKNQHLKIEQTRKEHEEKMQAESATTELNQERESQPPKIQFYQDVFEEQEFTEKNLYVLNFVTEVIKKGMNAWKELDEWFQTAPEKASEYLFGEIVRHIQKLFKNSIKRNGQQSTEKLLNQLQVVSGLPLNSSSASIVHKLWFQQLLSHSQHKVHRYSFVRRFILQLIYNFKSPQSIENNSSSKSPQTSHSVLNVPEILFSKYPEATSQQIQSILFKEMPERAVEFMRNVLQNQGHAKHLMSYLGQLRKNEPIKLKELFLSIDRTKEGEIFSFGRYRLIDFFKNNFPFEERLNLIRDLSVFAPSKFLIVNLIGFFNTTMTELGSKAIISQSGGKDSNPKKGVSMTVILGPEAACMRNTIARTINTILVRNEAEVLGEEFKKQLPGLAKELQKYPGSVDMFGNVGAKTLEALKKAFQQNMTFKV